MAGIIWLASYPKSGNTWLRAFLANLFRNPDKPLPINDLPNHILGDGFLIHYEQFTGKPKEQISPAEIMALRPRIHEWFAGTNPDNAIVKTHNACVLIEGKPLITPSATAGAIYVVRNPLDVVISYAHHYKIDIQRAVDLVCDDNNFTPRSDGQVEQYLMSWSGHVNSWLSAPGMVRHVMRYEDMLKAPRKAFGDLVRFLGLPLEPARLKKAIRFSSFRELSSQEKAGKFVESRPEGDTPFFRQGKAGSWKDVLSEDQVRQIIEHNAEMMQRFDYLDRKGRIKT